MLEKAAKAVGILQMAEAHLVNARRAYRERDWVKLGGHVGAAVDLGFALVHLVKGQDHDQPDEE